MSYGGSSGGAGRIATSSDVALNSPANNQVLSYNSSTQKWINATLPSSGGGSGSATGTYSQIVNVRDYGATGVEAQDATTIVKNAIAAVASKPDSAGVVYFPAGIYVVNEALSIPAHVYLEGESASNTHLRLYTQVNTTPFLTFGVSGQISTYTGLRRINIDAETNTTIAVRMYGPQEGSSISECLISGSTLHAVDIISSGIVGGSNKFVVEESWIWVNNSTGMSALNFGSGAGPLVIKNTTLVGINRSGGSKPTGSAGIIAAGGIFRIENVNVEYFESHTNATSSDLSMDSVTSFFCDYGVTIATNNTATVLTNVGFDNVTACLRNTTTGNTVGFFKNYRGEAYTSDRRSFDQNWWALGSSGIYSGTADRETQLGYTVYGNANTDKFKISSIKPGGSGWTEVANVDTSMTFGTGGSAYNAPHLRLGDYHLWIDSTGRLRVKASAPSSDTDGTIVGTQS